MVFNRQSAIGNRQSRGFTLLELLIVLGIIMILLSILVPTVNQVRISAANANTRQMISRLENGIASYYSEFKAYPGAFHNSQVIPFNGATAINGKAISPANVTSTENLLLSLMGGLQITVSGGAVNTFEYKETLATGASGPANLNPANLKRYGAFMTADSAEITARDGANQSQPTLPSGQWCAASGGIVGDTIVPEFLDKYSNPMPILYMRANNGATGGINTGTGYVGTAQYQTKQITTTYPNRNAQTAEWSPSVSNYFMNTSDTSLPAKKDEYILISAGPDGKYGTEDDITNFRTR